MQNSIPRKEDAVLHKILIISLLSGTERNENSFKAGRMNS